MTQETANMVQPELQAKIDARARELARQDSNMLLGYIAALQEQMLDRLDKLTTQKPAPAREAPQPLSQQPTQAPIQRPVQVNFEYSTVTVAVGLLFSEDKAVNKKVEEMANQGWELISNTQSKETFMSPAGRSLQFRRPKP